MNSFAVFKELMIRDVHILRAVFYKSVIEGMIFLTIAYIIYGLLLPHTGLKVTMVAPLFWGMLILVVAQEAYDCARSLATDIALNPALSFYRTLPISFSWFLVRYIVRSFLQLMLNSLLLFLGGELLFGPQLQGSLSRIVLFVFTYGVMIFFFATFALMTGAAASIAWFRDNMWSRIYIPFVFGGCLYVSWFSTYAIVPLFAVLFLLSPFTYAVEGLRAVVLGQEGYLPLSLCIIMMLLLSLIQIVLFRRWFIQRIDPVIETSYE